MKQDITPRNNKGQSHGLWVRYNYNNCNLLFKCQFINSIKYGYWIHNWDGIKPIIRLYLK